MKFEDFVSVDSRSSASGAQPISKKHAAAIGGTLCLAAALALVLPQQAPSLNQTASPAAAQLTAENAPPAANGVQALVSYSFDSTAGTAASSTDETLTAKTAAPAPADAEETSTPAAAALTAKAEAEAKSAPAAPAVPAPETQTAAAAPAPQPSLKTSVERMMRPDATLTGTLLAVSRQSEFEPTENADIAVAKEPQDLDNYDDTLPESALADEDSALNARIRELAEESSSHDGRTEVHAKWYVENIERGDTLSSIFTDLNIPYATMQAITSSKAAGPTLSSLRPGNTLSFLIDDNNMLVAFVKQLNKTEQLRFYRDDTTKLDFLAVREPLGAHLDDSDADVSEKSSILNGETTVALAKQPESAAVNPADIAADVPLYQRRGRLVVVKIEKGQAFSTAALNSGLTYSEIDQILRLFKGRIQFSRHIQPGDTMRVLFSDSKGKGKINAVEFNTKRLGKLATYRNLADNKYYDEHGLSTSSANNFRRFPLNGKVRISSGFNPNRRHPVTGRVRPHNGTDFAVPVGTPVVAPADGVVDKAAYSRSAGYYVVIRHRGSYSTVYMHLSKLGVKPGQRVKLGQVIARSGNTGLSTGPHLHYELRRNGRPVNAMRVNLPKNSDSAVKEQQRFANNVKLYKKELYQDSLIAKIN